MKKKNNLINDEGMREEYDFSQGIKSPLAKKLKEQKAIAINKKRVYR